ncbi:MAG: pyruvate-binding protein [Verrucomicrobiota bacterium]|jgi:hypothetical protein
MRTFSFIVGPQALGGITALALLAGVAQATAGDAIPYPNVGTPNPDVYTFTATTTGDIVAYFAGSTAGYDNELGLMVNGVSTGVVGLDDHSSYVGQSLDLGSAKAGDTLVFVLQNNTLDENAYSDPSMNLSYDNDGSDGHNHVYSTPYTATSPILDGIPVGTFVAFEDLPFPGSDFNYNDEDFVFTDVSVAVNSAPDSASTLTLFGMGLAAVGMLRRRLCR